MSVLTINAFPSTATITATYNEETITGIGQVVIEANDSTVVSYTVEAQQCTSKSGTFTISGDMTEAVALNYIGSVSVDTWVPSTGRDTFPTHIAMLGKGGWRSVESNDERDAIPSARREAGMSVYVASEKKLYILNSDLVTWSLFSAGGVVEMPIPSVTELGNIVQYIGETTQDYTQGYFYKCVSDGGDPVTYSWEQINVQPETDLAWGNITGTLSNQTDLQDALDAKQDTLTAGSGISITPNTQTGDLVISSTLQESSFRGRWNTWTDVPVIASEYPEDWRYNHTPTYNDYMVVEDASAYVPSDLLTVELIVLEMTNSSCRYKIGTQTYSATRQSGQNAPFGPNNEMSWNTQGMGTEGTVITFNDQVKYQDHVYNNGETIRLANESGSYSVADLPKSFFIKRNVGTFEGSWRFKYNGIWETDGKSGWVDEYQIESVIPSATDSVAGIAKLYTTTGQNEDGSVTQKLVTDELGTKQDTLTAGSGISIDANNVISATFSESYFRGKFSTWNTVPTDYRNYYPDYTGSTKPTRTDYMVVEDPSSYVKPGDPIKLYNEPMQGGTAFARFVFGATDITLNHNQVSQAGETGITIGTVGNQIKVTYNTPLWKITPLDVPIIVDGVEKPIGEVAYSWGYQNPSQETLVKELNFKGQGGYVGTWRFSYQSDNWDATGKNGWYPEYQIEDVLPIATDTDAGIMKLYTTTGSNTDGTMDQNSITTELGDLQDQIDDLKGLGRFLSVWNSSTGLPETNPSTSPYEYKSGDYYLVGTVSSSTNYRPDGLSYTTDVPSTVVETEEVHVNDVYIFDGAVWKLQANSQREYTFSGIAGDPYDNTNLGNALDAKQDLLTNASNAGEGIIIDDVTQEISTNNIVWRKW